MENKIYTYTKCSDYSSSTVLKQPSQVKIGFYSKKAMKSKYPAGGYKVVAMLKKKKQDDDFAVLNVGDISIPLSKIKSSPLTRTAGYIQTDSDEYIEIKKSNLAYLLLYIILLALIIAAIVFGVSRCSRPDAGNSTAGTIDKSIVLPDELTTVKHLDTTDKSIKIPGVPTLYFDANKKDQTHVFSNPEGNPCYFKVQIVLDDENKTIFESELIPPGYSIQKVTLKNELKKGTYKATINYLTYSFDSEMNELNNAVVKTDIEVK